MEDPHFARNCYHINRFFALSRMYTNTEAPNEQWVGALKYLYNPIKGDTTDTLTRRLRARIAGVRGEECDDAFLRKLSNSLEGAKPRRTGKKFSRAVESMLDNSRRQVDKEARPLLQTDFLSGPTDVTTVKVAEKSSIEQRKSVERAHMERPDLQLAKRMNADENSDCIVSFLCQEPQRMG